MVDEQKNGEVEDAGLSNRIDYEAIDVEDIMTRLRQKIAARPTERDEPEERLPSWPDDVPSYAPAPKDPGKTGRVKRLLIKIMRPFTPFIKLLAYPIHRELRDTIEILDQTNKRLDYLHDLQHRHYEELKPKIININLRVNERIDIAFNDINRLKEYTKLLHTMTHNLVVEMTKLKIEEENVKLKTRILEKDFEFLGRKEKALEDELFK
ncbi:MAG: hypothetical protein ABIJ35_01125 [Acidobacteriota bacterium]